MRSKKAFVIVMALIACLVVGGLATEAVAKKKKKIKVASAVSLTVTTTSTSGPYAPSTAPGTFQGNVTAGKGCAKGRSVTILKNGNVLGAVITNNSGNYLATLQGAGSGNYQAQVAKKKHKKKGKLIVCKGTISSVVTIG
jgi:hypothetical protein